MDGVITTGKASTGFWADLVGASDRWGRTILFATVLGRLAILPVVALIYILVPGTTGEGYSGELTDLGPAELVAALLVAPLVESLIIVFLVWLVGIRLGAPVWLTALLTAAVFVPMHGLVLVSLIIAPLFALMAAIQMNWRRKGREWTGFWIITAIHFLGNLSAVALTAIMPAP
ncbi:hypothetical protein [Brevundimonas sp. R86498]|uniref:hypothetical protein n=1 Tax=Brevundimonas sp. R86498 TaxID=3093845 RepID=UPI0037C80D19